MKKHILTVILSTSLASFAHAAPTAFDFKDPKGANAIQFSLDSMLEPIAGTAGGVAGTVTFDPAAPGATHGKIVIAAKSLVVPNATMNEHLVSPNWLDVATNPEIVFELVKLEGATTTGNVTSATATGKFTLKGVTKDLKVPVSFTHLPDKLGARVNDPKVKGDLLVLRANFSINRADFGIQAGKNTDKVAEAIQLSLSIAGAAPKG